VRLNPAGARYARQVREILSRLERETHDVSGMPADGSSLEIAVLPTFASRWLIPRLGQFTAQHPHIVVNIAARSDPFILPGSGFDAAIHFDHPAWTGMDVTFLFAEYLLPVCHAALLTDDDLPGLLNRLPRIHRRQNPDAWLHYARECGLALDNPAQGRATICMRWRSLRYSASRAWPWCRRCMWRANCAAGRWSPHGRACRRWPSALPDQTRRRRGGAGAAGV
jgi:DNA-binding transcriptional LysR family regulator